jgi:flagellar protein FliL
MTADAELDDVAQAEEQPAKGKLSRRMLLLIAAGLGLVVALGAGSYFLFFAGAKDPAAEAHKPVVPETFIFNLPTMTVNLNSEGGGDQFMKLTVAVEVANEGVMREIQPRMAKIVDAFQVYLRELRKSDLEGSAGIYRLKEELRRRINVAIYPNQVESILFREILVQ